jgi:hypothetical protein
MADQTQDNPYGCGWGGLIIAALLWLYGRYDITGPLRAGERRMNNVIALLVAVLSILALREGYRIYRSNKHYQRTHPLGKDGCATKVETLFCRGRTGKGNLTLPDGVVLHFKREADTDKYLIAAAGVTVFRADFVRRLSRTDYDAEPTFRSLPLPGGGFEHKKTWPSYMETVNLWMIETYDTDGNWELVLSKATPANTSPSSQPGALQPDGG